MFTFLLALILYPLVSPTLLDKKKSESQIVYTIDKEGLFLYDLKTGVEKKIYSTDQVFLDNTMTFLNDSILVIGHQTPNKREEYKTTDENVYITETFYAININNGIKYKYKTIDYEYLNKTTLNIKTLLFNNRNQIVTKKDTSILCNRLSYSYNRIKFCDTERYYSKSEIIEGKQIFSKRGNLYITNQKDTTLLLEFDGHFDPKFGSGYYQPTISPDCKKVSFQYLAGIFKSGSAIYEMDINTKHKKKIIEKGYFHPVYSPNGEKLLIAKDQRKVKENTWINTIYVLDIKTGTKRKIGKGSAYLWRPQ